MTRPLGALGYVGGFAEILEQAEALGFKPNTVVLATGSSGTQAGLLAGAKLLSPGTRVVGISVAAGSRDVARYVRTVAGAVLAELGEAPSVEDEEIIVLDDYIGKGYGVVYPEVLEALRLAAKEEGILLDPVYTGKALAGVTDLSRRGFFREGEKVVFLHTGGTPALFPYRQEILGGMD